MKHSGSTALALWSLVLKLSISIKHRHLNNSDMSCCTLLCCTVLNSLLSITNIIIFPIFNLQSALTTDFINHHNVLLCRLNVRSAARLNDASLNSATVICLLACSCLLLRCLQFSVALLKRHQQAWGMYYSGFNRIRWVHVHAIKNTYRQRTVRNLTPPC